MRVLAFGQALAPTIGPMAFEKNFFPRQVVEAGNRWDWALLPLVLAGLVLLGYGGAQMTRPYHVGDVIPLSLDPWQLPYYLLRTTMRMLIALAFSLLFAFAFATAASRRRGAQKGVVPPLDNLPSNPPP